MRPSGCRLMGFFSGNGEEPRNRMREIFTYGSVGRAPGNRCFYPEGVMCKKCSLEQLAMRANPS